MLATIFSLFVYLGHEIVHLDFRFFVRFLGEVESFRKTWKLTPPYHASKICWLCFCKRRSRWQFQKIRGNQRWQGFAIVFDRIFILLLIRMARYLALPLCGLMWTGWAGEDCMASYG